MTTAKVSVAIGEEELAWARSVARREGKSLSAIVTESLAERRRLSALRDVVAWMAEGEAPLTKEELDAANREISRPPPPRAARRSRSRGTAARRR